MARFRRKKQSFVRAYVRIDCLIVLKKVSKSHGMGYCSNSLRVVEANNKLLNCGYGEHNCCEQLQEKRMRLARPKQRLKKMGHLSALCHVWLMNRAELSNPECDCRNCVSCLHLLLVEQITARQLKCVRWTCSAVICVVPCEN